ncbi:MAG: hypothetical protein GXO62_07435 [Epsilonproteobacteria bacterium]|nr:hypothetical protein [Campylobacterota bacterium]
MRKSFSLIEVIFVIVIISILTTLALPKFQNTINSSYLIKAKNEIAYIKAAISSAYAKNIMQGVDVCPQLEGEDENAVFEKIISKPLNSAKITWKLTAKTDTSNQYTLTIQNQSTTFTYEKNTSKNCPFYCNGNKLCEKLRK